MDKRLEMLNLMQTMANNIVAVEAVAEHMAQVAADLEADGQSDTADVLRMVGRNHRVRSMELQGQLAALSADYAVLFQSANDEP